MTDKPKKYKVTKRVYNKVESTYWEEFEMTQDNQENLIAGAKEQDGEDSVKDLPQQMTNKIEDWEYLYSICSHGEYENCEDGTWEAIQWDEEQTFIEEVKK